MKTLRPYQLEDVAKLVTKNAMGVFNEQRTGKTPTSLVAADQYGSGRILIIAPASLLYNWKDEFEYWLGRPCVVCEGTKKNRLKAIADWTDGMAINYEALRVTSTADGLWEQVLKCKPEAVILDEAHRIKGRTNATAKAVNKFKNIRYKLALTGTPAPNRQDEIWAILHWLYPKIFSSYWDFIGEYFKTAQQTFGENEITTPLKIKPELVMRFQNILNNISVNRKRRDVMEWLPDEVTPMRIRLPLHAKQKDYLGELEQYYTAEHVITQGTLDRLIRYRQICLAPALLDLKGPSPKLIWIKQYMTDYPDVPTIIFSKFSKWLHYVQKETDGKVKVYDGGVSLPDRADLIKQFQSGKINILAIQIDAGKEGLTLDRAECLVFTDVIPPASDVLQARARIIATTPDKAHIPKQVIELMMRDTYDEELYNLVDSNAEYIDIINSYNKYLRKKGE